MIKNHYLFPFAFFKKSLGYLRADNGLLTVAYRENFLNITEALNISLMAVKNFHLVIPCVIESIAFPGRLAKDVYIELSMNTYTPSNT